MNEQKYTLSFLYKTPIIMKKIIHYKRMGKKIKRVIVQNSFEWRRIGINDLNCEEAFRMSKFSLTTKILEMVNAEQLQVTTQNDTSPYIMTKSKEIKK